MKVYFARHGRTNYNDLQLCNSDPTIDVHLTTAGTEQARELASRLKNISLDCIIVSELPRTQQTAEIVRQLQVMPVPIQIDSLLNDHRSGFEGQPFQQLKSALEAADDKWTAHFNDGESIADMKQRVAHFLEDLKAKPYNRVLVVTSQWIIHAAAALVQGISNEQAWELDIEQGDFIALDVQP